MAVKTKVTLRPATSSDLLFINGIIEAAVMSWKLPERVKRLSMPSYRYDAKALERVHMQVASDADDDIVGVVAWCAPDAESELADRRALLLHGVFVDPTSQRQSVGKVMVKAALKAANKEGFDGLLVNAQPDALPFFEGVGFEQLPVVDEEQDYILRYWQACAKK